MVVVVLIAAFMFMSKRNAPQQQLNQQPTSVPQTQITSAPTTEQKAVANSVTIENFAYSPASLTVKVGDTVTWTNQDTVGHSATADDNSFDTGIFSQGKTGSFTFTKAGTYPYHCSVHPNMKGTIIVE